MRLEHPKFEIIAVPDEPEPEEPFHGILKRPSGFPVGRELLLCVVALSSSAHEKSPRSSAELVKDDFAYRTIPTTFCQEQARTLWEEAAADLVPKDDHVLPIEVK
jgi:hypothetical protein